MELFKVSLALVLVVTLASVPFSLAHNSQQDYLDAHNAARAQVGVGPMHWDEEVAAYALDFATEIQRANACNEIVISGGPYGENFAADSGPLTGREAVNLWVEEKRYYDYRSNSCDGGFCASYIQVVWRSSVSLGCARVQCNSGWWYVICFYSPGGNIKGQRPY